jgi:hypothetical protein
MFIEHEADVRETGIDEIVAEQKSRAKNRLIEVLAGRSPLKFADVVTGLLQPFMLRETNVKDICVDLAKEGKIENTWGGGNRKPQDDNMIMRKAAP